MATIVAPPWEEPDGSELVGFQQIGAGAVARTANSKLREIVSVNDFGAVGDGVTDDSAAFQAALNAVAAAGGGTVRLPPGRYYCPNNSATRLIIVSSVSIEGAGMFSSVIMFGDSAGASRRDLLTTDGTVDYDITISGVGFESDWGAGGSYVQRSHLVEIHTTGVVEVKNCRFSNSRFMSLVVDGSESVTVTGCYFNKGRRDGCRVTNSDRVVIKGNTFRSICDDSIAVHTADSAAAPVQGSIVISGNVITDGQGIASLGGKHVAISDNVLTRIHTRAIEVGIAYTYVEGGTSAVGVSITGNVITDVFSGYVFDSASGGTRTWIAVSTALPTSFEGGYVAQSNGASVVPPYPYFYTNDTDGTAPSSGNWFVNVSNNVCVRTLSATSAYSNYGYGSRLMQNGPADPAITSSLIGGDQIVLNNRAWNCVINGNTLSGGDRGLYLAGTSASNYISWRNISVTGNVVTAWAIEGIFVKGTGEIQLTSNIFDGDPYFESSYRGAGGTWGASYAQHKCLRADTARMVVQNNTIKNVGRIFSGAGFSSHHWSSNVVFCNPVSAGYNAGNVGVGDTGPVYEIGEIVVEDGDPASLNYGKIINTCPIRASSMPTAGKYLIGHFVSNVATTVYGSAGSRYMVLGWKRATTGTGHVLNTDWVEMHYPTGT